MAFCGFCGQFSIGGKINNWKPGLPVVTAEDIQAWQAWKKESKLAAQRYRRGKYPRIDYYPGKEARAVILNHVGTYSSVIDSIILEWVSGIK